MGKVPPTRLSGGVTGSYRRLIERLGHLETRRRQIRETEKRINEEAIGALKHVLERWGATLPEQKQCEYCGSTTNGSNLCSNCWQILEEQGKAGGE